MLDLVDQVASILQLDLNMMTTTTDSKASKAAATRMRNMTVAKLRTMSPKARRNFWRKAAESAETVERLTRPCNGEAHTNPMIDSCGVCMSCVYGRMLKACDHTDCILVSEDACMHDAEG